jgi:prolyl oligopeptidase
MRSVTSLPFSPIESVTETIHGVPVTDPYRWLEDQNSPRTRAWIEEQTSYARAYLDGLPERDHIRGRVRELLDVETYDSFMTGGRRYFFRKRLPGEEQPSIYFREGAEGKDQLLVDPARRGTGAYTAVKPLRVSWDGNLLLYEVKEGGERSGIFEILDIANRETLPDFLPHGYLRGFAFAPDNKSFYYTHEATEAKRPFYRGAYHHVLGSSFEDDREIFAAGEDRNIRLCLVGGKDRLGFLVHRFLDKTYRDFYLWTIGSEEAPKSVLRGMAYIFGPRFVKQHLLAITDRDAPNCRIVEVGLHKDGAGLFVDLVPAADLPIRHWVVAGDYLLVSYSGGAKVQTEIFALSGRHIRSLRAEDGDTIRLTGTDSEHDEVVLERESFVRPVQIFRYSVISAEHTHWASRKIPFDPQNCARTQLSFSARDGMRIPIFLAGRPDLLEGGPRPTILTSYGGFGVPMTPQFSVLVAFLIEHGCLFALPNIRGGSEFGVEWHNAAKRRSRQTAFDDFLSAAEWLIQTGRTTPAQLAIFGGSNSGLLVAAAMTQRPDLFRAVLCMVPMLDMLRYHLFDHAHVWKEEFGTADDAEDFLALIKYSPYHVVREEAAYPATMIVSGDVDQSCNPMHARKMTARLQAANSSDNPILLDYTPHRGHSPVLPLSHRIGALADRLAFLCEQLQLGL